MPKDLYRAYTIGTGQGRRGATNGRFGGSLRDSPPVFNNLLAYKDEIVPWVRQMSDAVHEAGAAIMIR